MTSFFFRESVQPWRS